MTRRFLPTKETQLQVSSRRFRPDVDSAHLEDVRSSIVQPGDSREAAPIARLSHQGLGCFREVLASAVWVSKGVRGAQSFEENPARLQKFTPLEFQRALSKDWMCVRVRAEGSQSAGMHRLDFGPSQRRDG